MSYTQASQEAERLISCCGWFQSWDVLAELRQIMLQTRPAVGQANASDLSYYPIPYGAYSTATTYEGEYYKKMLQGSGA